MCIMWFSEQKVPVAVSNINRVVLVMKTHYVANYLFLSRQQSSGPSHVANKSSENVTIRTQMFAKYTIR